MRWPRAFPMDPFAVLVVVGTVLTLAVWSAVVSTALWRAYVPTAKISITAADRRLSRTRRFCDVYDSWKSSQLGARGVPDIDEVCFTAQEMKP